MSAGAGGGVGGGNVSGGWGRDVSGSSVSGGWGSGVSRDGPSRWGSAVVGYAGLARPQELVGAMSLEEVFTPAERVRSAGGRTLQHWAGRLAAKRAVLRLLGVPPTAERLGQVEVLPEPTPVCRGDAACLTGHPPAVRLTGRLAGLGGSGSIRVSLSHTAQRALAVALRTARLPEDAAHPLEDAAHPLEDAAHPLEDKVQPLEDAARSPENEEDR
ncbi:hypothetical protein ACFFMN_15015 [Planobispora siamensis]|uniref:Phosphopantetheinyl transferase (Holo-ACP synthase) n=1 Tax=Planobispora siamensis TaxID=936338 RepID=A0A8J3SR11_9ACTN|nr:hypothetical protein [Planobispora siamensis]GIH96819.1 hypothetical protein Psi01_74490 [Planobispora siamensis]